MQSEVETLSVGGTEPPGPPPPTPTQDEERQAQNCAAWQEGTGPGTPLQRLEKVRSLGFYPFLIWHRAEGSWGPWLCVLASPRTSSSSQRCSFGVRTK